jgi:hypothetical protein
MNNVLSGNGFSYQTDQSLGALEIWPPTFPFWWPEAINFRKMEIDSALPWRNPFYSLRSNGFST